MSADNRKITEGAEIILFICGNLKAGEKVCIVSERGTSDVGRILYRVARGRNIIAEHLIIKPLKMHGQEPPKAVAARMLKNDLVIGVTKLSMAHTKTRYNINRKGVRYLSLPGYSVEMLKDRALRVDFKASARKAKRLARQFTRAKKAAIFTKNGTAITLEIGGRNGNFCPGYVDSRSKMGSPPDIESNIAPIEDRSDGIVVVDASIAHPEFGKLKRPIRLIIKKGNVIDIRGDAAYVRKLNRIFCKYGKRSKVLAELGAGFNKNAKVCGNMLLDEGAYGTFHIGFGSNSTIGGVNKANFHLDVVFYANEIVLDGRVYAV